MAAASAPTSATVAVGRSGAPHARSARYSITDTPAGQG
jgi:hypothetical protein